MDGRQTVLGAMPKRAEYGAETGRERACRGERREARRTAAQTTRAGMDAEDTAGVAAWGPRPKRRCRHNRRAAAATRGGPPKGTWNPVQEPCERFFRSGYYASILRHVFRRADGDKSPLKGLDGRTNSRLIL